MLALLITTLFLGSPVVLGAVIAQLLRTRGQRWWIFVPRYFAAWIATFMTLGMIGATFGSGNFNGAETKDFEIWKSLILIGVPAFVTFLIVRRWRKPKNERGAEAQ